VTVSGSSQLHAQGVAERFFECTDGTATTFDQARAEFEALGEYFRLSGREADYQASRDARDWTERKYALWDAGKRLPRNEWEPGKPCSI
jgi:hypothetical protein